MDLLYIVIFINSILYIAFLNFIIFIACGCGRDNNKKIKQDKLKLFERMLKYKLEMKQTILPYETFIVHLKLKKSKIYNEAAKYATAKDIAKHFTGDVSYVYCHMNEIILVFPAQCTMKEYDETEIQLNTLFGGDIVKLVSNISSYASTRYLCNVINYYDEKIDYTKLNYQFESQIVVFPSNKSFESTNYVLSLSQELNTNMLVKLCKENCADQNMYKKNYYNCIEMLDSIDGTNIYSDKSYAEKYGYFLKYVPKHLTNTTYTDDRVTNDIVKSKVIVSSFKPSYQKITNFINTVLDSEDINHILSVI